MASKLKELSDVHMMAIRLKIEGRSGQEIADACGVQLRTIYLWFGQQIVKDELSRQRQNIVAVFAERMSEVGMRAINMLEDLAQIKLDTEEVTVQQKLEIIREILDRIPLTAKQGQQVNGNYGTPSVPIPGLSPDGGPPAEKSDTELMAEFREVAALLPGVAVVESNGHAGS